MPIGTTNISLKNSMYAEMDKDPISNISLQACRYGQNDIDIGTYAQSNVNQVNMSYWQNYDHMNMTFRFNSSVSLRNDTYDDEDTANFGTDTVGVAFTGTNTTDGASWKEFNGSNAYGTFEAVNAGVAYKLGSGTTAGVGFWVRPNGTPAGATEIMNTNGSIGSLSSYQGWRFLLQSDLQLRVLRGDGDGTGVGDRRTFETAASLRRDIWNFVYWQGTDNSTTVGTSNNYFWVWNAVDGWNNGAGFLSGTGGSINYDNTKSMTLSAATAGSRYFNGDFGGIWFFDQVMATSDIETLREQTDNLS
jgi:hypothetical protein